MKNSVAVVVIGLVSTLLALLLYMEVEYDLLSKVIYTENVDSNTRIELVDDGSFELVDSDYDGRIDVSNKYDLEGELVFTKLDNNYDGYLETKVFFESGRSTKALVDTDKNGLFDLVFLYEVGSKSKAIKFEKSKLSFSSVNIYDMNFGFPEGSFAVEEGTTETEFSLLYDQE